MIFTLMFLFQMNCSMEHRGDAVMGFSHETTTHAFKLSDDGGAIEVVANDPKDAKSIEAIRAHLREIAKAFAKGDFSKPKAIHEELPDGAAEMRELRNAIKYDYAATERGGRVRITTSDAKALDAVHRFLKFQVREHHTERDPAHAHAHR
jgi:site-specific recombinase XerD